MYFRIAFMISFLTLCFTTALSQAAPDLGILWQKENIGVDIQFAKFSKDGQFVYCATETNILKMSAETGEILSTFDNTGLPTIYRIFSLSISNSGNFLAANNGYGEIFVWDTRTEKPYKAIIFGERGKDSSSNNAVFTLDERYLIINFYLMEMPDKPEYICIYNLETDEQVARWYVSGKISQIAISHDGKYFATGITYRDNFTEKWHNKLVLWETATWKEAAVLEDVEGDLAGYSNIVFSFDDSYIGTTRNILHDVHIFSLQTKKLIKTSEPSKLCGGILFLPDNLHFLLTNYDINSSVRTMELHDFEKMIKVYPFYFIATLNVYNDNGYWKIFGSLVNNIALITNKPNTVTENNPDNNINLFYENDKIIIETTNFNSSELNVLLTDITGKSIYRDTKSILQVNSRFIIEIVLPVGVYLAKVTYGNKNYSFKIEVAR